jgi:ABC-type microcin C transport system permease subunit YejB
MKALIMIIVAVLSITFCGIEVQAGRNTDRLIQSIRQQQKAAEKKIVQMWMSGKRDKEFEIVLANYVAREVRYRAMTGESNTGSLLSAVNRDKSVKLDKPINLGRLIVLEYFKRKGINLKDKSFVKGTYNIGLK